MSGECRVAVLDTQNSRSTPWICSNAKTNPRKFPPSSSTTTSATVPTAATSRALLPVRRANFTAKTTNISPNSFPLPRLWTLSAVGTRADCCDGSDEKPGRCENTCKDKSKESSQGLVAKAKEYQAVRTIQGLKIRLKAALEATTEVDKLKTSLSEAKAEKEKILKTKEMAAVLKVDFQQRSADSESAKRAEALSSQYDSKVAALDSEITKLEQTLGKDYGPFNEFFSLREDCFSAKSNQFEYKICPFSKAEQLESGRSTNLGQWKGFQNTYKEMVFDEGLRCYKGPARSMTLTLECGERSEVVQVEEPEMCVYRGKFRTPLVCTAERFEELLKSAQF